MGPNPCFHREAVAGDALWMRLYGLAGQVGTWARPGKVENNLARLAQSLNIPQ